MIIPSRLLWYIIGRYNSRRPYDEWVDDTLIGMDTERLSEVEDRLAFTPSPLGAEAVQLANLLKTDVLPVEDKLLRSREAMSVIGSFIAYRLKEWGVEYTMNEQVEEYDPFMPLALTHVMPIPVLARDELFYLYAPRDGEGDEVEPLEDFMDKLVANLIRTKALINLERNILALGPLTFTFNTGDGLIFTLKAFGLQDVATHLINWHIINHLPPRMRGRARRGGEEIVVEVGGTPRTMVRIKPLFADMVTVTVETSHSMWTLQYRKRAAVDNLAVEVEKMVEKAGAVAGALIRAVEDEVEAFERVTSHGRITVEYAEGLNNWIHISYPAKGLPISIPGLLRALSASPAVNNVKAHVGDKLLAVVGGKGDPSQLASHALRAVVKRVETVLEARSMGDRVGPEHLLAVHVLDLTEHLDIMLGLDPTTFHEKLKPVLDKLLLEHERDGRRNLLLKLVERGVIDIDLETGEVAILGRPLHEILREFPAVEKEGLARFIPYMAAGYAEVLEAITQYYGVQEKRRMEKWEAPVFATYVRWLQRLARESPAQATAHLYRYHPETLMGRRYPYSRERPQGVKVGPFTAVVLGLEGLSRDAPKLFAIFRPPQVVGVPVRARTVEEAVRGVEDDYDWYVDELKQMEREGLGTPVSVDGEYKVFKAGRGLVTLEDLEGRRSGEVYSS